MNTAKTYNILVTGVGAIIGYGIIESLRMSGINCRITGIDIYEECYGRYICDNFERAPYANDPSYYEWFDKICKKHAIDLIIPGIEQDLFSYNGNRDILPVTTVLNNEKIINLSRDKYDTYCFLSGITGIHVIDTRVDADYNSAVRDLGLPFIIKPRRSYASKGFHIIRDESDYKKVKEEITADTLFQRHIGSEDEEYTFSVFGKGDGSTIDQIILRRYLSKEGATQKAFVVDKDDELQGYVDKIVQNLHPEGPTNFQFRKQNGVPYLLEINPRISSACSIRSKFGYNEPLYCIQHYLQGGNYTIGTKKSGKAIRYIADNIVYE